MIHFLLSGHVSKQNMRFWAMEQPHAAHREPLHIEKLTVRCALSSEGIIGPMSLMKLLIPSVICHSWRIKLYQPSKRSTMQDVLFMQDGAPPHTSSDVIDYQHNVFGERDIQRCKVVALRGLLTPDLNPCDYFLWGYLKSRVYKPKPTDTCMLLRNIKREIRGIRQETCSRVIDNFTLRVREGKTMKRTTSRERHKLLNRVCLYIVLCFYYWQINVLPVCNFP